MADCSFCGKGEDEVVRLVPGPGVAICNECVVSCGKVLDAQGDGRPHRRYATVTPRMVVGDVDGAVAFLQAALGATVEGEADGPIELRIGDSLVMVGGAELRDVFPTFVYVYVDDADDAHRRAVAAGAETIEAPLDTPYGDRRAMVRDPWGNLYQLAHRPR